MTEGRINELMWVVEQAAVETLNPDQLREVVRELVRCPGASITTVMGALGLSTKAMDVLADMLLLLAGARIEDDPLELKQEAWQIGRESGWVATEHLPMPTE